MIHLFFYEDKNAGRPLVVKSLDGCDAAAEARQWLAVHPYGRVEIRYL